MDATDHPCPDLSHDTLAALCAQRAEALRARAWRDESERDLLREDTARLLQAVACRLGADVGIESDAAWHGDALRDYLDTHVEHQPLSTRPSSGHPGKGPAQSG